MDQSGKDQAPSDLESLTERELEIIELMRAGLTNKEIARQMSLAYETIKWYTKRIYSKLNIKNRNQLIPRLENLPRLRPNANTLEKYGRWASPLTTFIGRAAEKEALLKIVSNNRLVSIVGPGGIGKTRMALEIGRLAETHLERKTYLLTAEPFHTRDEFIFSLADLFHISLNSYDSPINQIAAGLPSVPMLLIIDNFESVIDTAPDLIPLLTHNSNLNILLTSRSATRLNDEMIFWLNGLSQEADSSIGNEAIHLFRARAHMSHQQHSRQENNAEIAEICQLVGGNPLAIELAASWSRSLTHQQILTELKSGLEILASDSLDISDRHRSMTAICEQSWLTLRPAARKAALKLGLFESSFSWEAAREI
ncbi:MAG: LuxR C-terminal-related transcriptional regulator, partial [Chloroflexota bacterium]